MDLKASELPLIHLRHRWVVLAATSLLALAGGTAFLVAVWQPVYAWRWLGFAGLATLYILWMVWRNLPANTSVDDSTLRPYLGAANVISLVRGMMIALVAGFVFSPRPPGGLAWIPGLVYMAVALLDFLDGYLARRLNQSTRLGEILDINFDGLGVLAAVLLVVLYGQAPVWYLLVGLARYLFLFGLFLRRRFDLPVYELSPNLVRRALAGLQMGYMFVLLWPVFGPPGSHFVGVLFSVPFLVQFLWDWLTVCGRVNQPGSNPRWLEYLVKQASRFAVTALPVILRVGVVVMMLDTAVRWLTDWTGQVAFYRSTSTAHGVQIPEVLIGVWALLEWLVIALIAAGAAGRITAIVGLCLLGLHQLYMPLSNEQYLLALLLAGVLILGTGSFSLWKPEELVIFRKLGERPRQQIPEVAL